MTTAWAVFACLRARPTAFVDLQSSIDWLLRHRCAATGGWSYSGGARSKVKTFYTAYAINALIEYVRCVEIIGTPAQQDALAPVKEAIRGGVLFLTLGSPRQAENGDMLLWSQDPKSQDFCLASTSMAVHVLGKWNRHFDKLPPNVVKPLRCTVELLCKIIRSDYPSVGLVNIAGQKVQYDPWPTFKENVPPYWYEYFTPIMAVTLLDTAGDLEVVDDSAGAMRATIDAVRWISKSIVQQTDGKPGLLASPGQRSIALWSTLQGILILHRWRKFLAEFLFNPANLSLLATE